MVPLPIWIKRGEQVLLHKSKTYLKVNWLFYFLKPALSSFRLVQWKVYSVPFIAATPKAQGIPCQKQTKKIRGLGPRANYIDLATASCRRS
jgi:hypothetical protein